MCAKAEALLLSDDLQTVFFAFADRVRIHNVDNIGELNDPLSRVLGFILVQNQVSRTKDSPHVFPLLDTSLAPQQPQPSLPDDPVRILLDCCYVIAVADDVVYAETAMRSVRKE